LVKNESVSLESVLRMRLEQQLARFELVFLARAYEDDPAELDRRLHAMLLARESREASTQVGRQLLRNACDLFSLPSLDAASGRLPYQHHAVVFGVVGCALGLPLSTAATAYAFQAVRGQISAAQRLTRLGQTEAQRLLHRLKPEIEGAASIADSVPLEEAAAFVPVLDVAAMAHERSAVRLFVS